MEPNERNYLRSLQDQFLGHPTVVHKIKLMGEDYPITGQRDDPTFKDLKEKIYPAWRAWIERSIGDL